MATQLSNMKVDRVDAVDDPATGRRFLILKAANPADVAAGAQQLADACAAVLKQLASDSSLSMSQESAAALQSLAKMLSVDFTPPAKEAPASDAGTVEADKAADAGQPVAAAATPQPVAASAAPAGAVDMAAVQAMIEAAVTKAVAASKPKEEAVSKGSAQAKSAQVDLDAAKPEKKVEKRKMGEGLFSNIVLGRASNMPR